jgi:hypothetical protein
MVSCGKAKLSVILLATATSVDMNRAAVRRTTVAEILDNMVNRICCYLSMKVDRYGMGDFRGVHLVHRWGRTAKKPPLGFGLS